MRRKEVNGVAHDLIHLESWKNPLGIFCIKNKFKIDLITGKTNQVEEDSLSELCKNKSKWFLERIKKLNGNLNDFQKAEITVFMSKERVEIIYRNKLFEREFLYG